MIKEITRIEFNEIKDNFIKINCNLLPFYYTEQSGDEVGNPEFRHYTSQTKNLGPLKLSSNGRPDFLNSECVFQIWSKLQNDVELVII